MVVPPSYYGRGKRKNYVFFPEFCLNIDFFGEKNKEGGLMRGCGEALVRV
jgi:hypothetical protein